MGQHKIPIGQRRPKFNLTVINHAAQFSRLVFQIGQFEAQLEVLLFEESGADGDFVFFGASSIAGPFGGFVVLPPPFPVSVVFDLLSVASALFGASIG